jgi:hypothetical protein
MRHNELGIIRKDEQCRRNQLASTEYAHLFPQETLENPRCGSQRNGLLVDVIET